MVDTRQYEVKYEDGITEITAMNLLAENILTQVDEHRHKYQILKEIGGHRKSEEVIRENNDWYITGSRTQRCRHATKEWELYTIWKDSLSNWIPLEKRRNHF